MRDRPYTVHIITLQTAGQKGDVNSPCQDDGGCVDDNAGCVRGKCRCVADYFLMDGDCGENNVFLSQQTRYFLAL